MWFLLGVVLSAFSFTASAAAQRRSLRARVAVKLVVLGVFLLLYVVLPYRDYGSGPRWQFLSGFAYSGVPFGILYALVDHRRRRSSPVELHGPQVGP